MNVVVDSPVWSLALRRENANLNPNERMLVSELHELVREGRVALIGSVRQEVLSGVRDGGVFERLRRHLRGFEDEPLSPDDYEEAARSANQCRSRGITGSPVDFLICAVAQRRGMSIFTTDLDFTHYSRVLPLVLHEPRANLRQA